MDKDIKKSYKLTMLVAILCLIVIVGSTTYAYFKTRIKGNGTKLNVNTKTFDINIEESDMTLTSLVPIYDTDKETKANSKTFTVSSNNITSGCINMYLAIDEIGKNLISKYLKYELKSDDTTEIIASGDFSNATNQSTINLIKNSNLSDINNNAYTLRVWISYVDGEDQSSILTGSDADRTLKLHVKVSGYTGECKNYLVDQMLDDNKVISERTDFTNVEIGTIGILFKTNMTEDGSLVYYYSGDTSNNWVKFGKYTGNSKVYGFSSAMSTTYNEFDTMEECNNSATNVNCHYLYETGDDMYWKIIRTNEDGGLRLLYSGIDPTTNEGFIGKSVFNLNIDDLMYGGYMYGTSGSLENNRQNTNDSTIKTVIDKWYEDNLLSNYDKYISKSAIYCNDRSVGNGTYNTSLDFDYGAYTRLYTNKTPSYKCGANSTNELFESTQSVADKFSASISKGGNGQLKYPAALMTADELVFAGVVPYEKAFTWYYANRRGESITNQNIWWTMSPSYSDSGTLYQWNVLDTNSMNDDPVDNVFVVRPVISLAKCALYASGDGTADNPYEIDYDNSCN